MGVYRGGIRTSDVALDAATDVLTNSDSDILAVELSDDEVSPSDTVEKNERTNE